MGGREGKYALRLIWDLISNIIKVEWLTDGEGIWMKEV